MSRVGGIEFRICILAHVCCVSGADLLRNEGYEMHVCICCVHLCVRMVKQEIRLTPL